MTDFDYELQVWVKNNIIQRCGHPISMRQCCNAGKYHGLPVEEAKKLVNPTPRKTRITLVP